MRPTMCRAACAAMISLVAAVHGSASDAVVVVGEGADLAPATLRTVRFVAEQELQSRGVAVLAAPDLDGEVTVGAHLGELAEERGVRRVFVVRLGRLDEKVLFSLEELQAPTMEPVFQARLTAVSVDEAERVLGRLAEAVVRRVPVADTARIQTVTYAEGEGYHKKPGEHLFVLGLNLAPIGGSLGWSYEADHWRLGALFHGAKDQLSYIGIEGAYLFSDGSFSPYVGAGLGVVGEDDSYLGAKVEVGVEGFRLHGVRLMAGVYGVLGFEDHAGDERFSPGVFLRLGF